MKRSLRFLFGFAALGAALAPAANPIQNEHQVPAVWAATYGINGALDLAVDTDGDGLTNGEEAAAGTDPFKPNDILAVTDISADANGVYLTFPTRAGKRYQVQATSSLSPVNWGNTGNPYAGNDGHVTAEVVETNATQKYYRIVVADIDSDGDGINDWEELKLGLDPFSISTDGSQADLAVATNALAPTSTITINAADDLATEPTGTNPPTDLATFNVQRTGGLRPVTLTFTVAASSGATEGVDFAALNHTITFGLGQRTAKIVITPLADAPNPPESPEPVVLTLNPGNGYTLGAQKTAGITIADYNSNLPTGTGVQVQFWNEALPADGGPGYDVPAAFAGEPVATFQDRFINYSWGTGSPAAGVNAEYFSSRWTGEIMPEFSQTYTFYLTADNASRLWIGGQLLIDNFPRPGGSLNTNALSASVDLQAGVRYPIRVDHYDITGAAQVILEWLSESRPREVVPRNRLFGQVAPQFTGDRNILVLVSGETFTYDLKANFSGAPVSFTADNLPPGWSVNATTGLISGVPSASLAGTWDVPVAATNSHGKGGAILHFQIVDTGSAFTRDVWTGTYASLAAVPFGSTPGTTNSISTELGFPIVANAPAAANRLRGFITAPVTGTFQFHLAGSNEAELWISDDTEINNLWKRATLSTPTTQGSWTGSAVSPLLYMKTGQRYYFEVRQRHSTVGSGHLSVGWVKPGDQAAAPEAIPAVNLSPYVTPPPPPANGTLYVTKMAAQGNAVTNGSGSATLFMNASETQAIVRYTYANLTGPISQKHVHTDSWNNKPSEIIFDMDVVQPQADGSYVWDLQPTQNYSIADIRQLIKDGASYINLHTATYSAGEIRGNYALAAGSQTAPSTPPTPSWTDDHTNYAAAARFLVQASYGPTEAEIASVQELGYEGWINAQFNKPTTYLFPYVFANRNVNNFGNGQYTNNAIFNGWWQSAITAPDQLRQRMAFALSEIFVVSRFNELESRNDGVADYYDMLADNSFGNFRNLLEEVTLHPIMGLYLDMHANDKPDRTKGRIPNENYAREILQLFALGLYRMWPDGSLVLNSQNLPIDTYDQDAIIGFAHAFTGWHYHQNGTYVPGGGTYWPTNFNPAAIEYPNAAGTIDPSAGTFINPMKQVPGRHFTGQKRLLNNVVLPGLTKVTMNNVVQAPPDPWAPDSAPHSPTYVQTPEYQNLPAEEIDLTHDAIFNHPNVGPFICRQLIQRFVTSTPSREYLHRVVLKFNNNGSGVRGDMKAVIKAILLDYEARSTTERDRRGFGKQREPLMRVTALGRAFAPSGGFTADYVQDGGVLKVGTVTPTSPAHRMVNNGWVNLSLTKSASSTNSAGSGAYQIYNFDTNPNNLYGEEYLIGSGSTSFAARAKDCFRASFVHNNTTQKLTITTNANHNLAVGARVYIRFRTGTNPSTAPTGGTPLDNLYAVTAVNSGTVFVVDLATVPTGYSCVDVQSLRAGYTHSGTTTRVECFAPHGLTVGQRVYAYFVQNNGGTVVPANFYTVTPVDADTFTLSVPTTGSNSGVVTIGVQFGGEGATQSARATAATTCLNRSGTVQASYSDYNVGLTENELDQSPLYAPTVFNYFLPDYQFPGALAASGMFTPEFQLTSETSVIRSANFMRDGIFASGTTSGLNSFRNSAGNIGIDFGRWMGVRAVADGGSSSLPNDYWTNGTATTGNLPALVDRLSNLLMGGPLPTQARTIILNFAASNAALSDGGTYSTTAPTETHRRDRVRSIVHLIATSPDFNIQK